MACAPPWRIDRAVRKIGHLNDLGERKPAGSGPVQEPGDAGLARAHEIIMLLRRAHLRAGETLQCDAPPESFSKLSAHLISHCDMAC